MWKDRISARLKVYLDKEVRGTWSSLKAIRQAKSKSNAQLWVAIANLSMKLDEIEQRLVKLEVRKGQKELIEALDDM